MSFPQDIRSKVNIIAGLEFELAYKDIAVQHVSHYATGTLPPVIYLRKREREREKERKTEARSLHFLNTTI